MKTQQEKQFLFDLSRHYKIWFSKDPNHFLGIENELRFIRMRQNNPNFTLYFIYSSLCLSIESIEKLQLFAAKHQIIPIEFETIGQDLVHQQDIQLFEIAKQEIALAKNSMAGSMAAAADCTRLIIPVIEKYGIYSDFDVETHPLKLNSNQVYIKCPILLTAEIIPFSLDKVILNANSDFLAFSLDEAQNGLSPEALGAIRNLQSKIIANYEQPFSWEILFAGQEFKDFKNYPDLKSIFSNFHQQYPVRPSIYNFRSYVETLDNIQSAKTDMSSKNFLALFSVISISGPGTYTALFADHLPQELSDPPLHIPFQETKWKPFLLAFRSCGLHYCQQIQALVSTKNSYHGAKEAKRNEQLCDLSWTSGGIQNKKRREIQMSEAATIIQNSIHRKMFWEENHRLDINKFPDEFLFLQVKKVCSDESIKSQVKNRQYPLALRRACYTLKLPVVTLLLKYHQEQGLAININESSSNGKTALDWVLTAKANNISQKRIQENIANLLKEAGAITADDYSNSRGNTAKFNQSLG